MKKILFVVLSFLFTGFFSEAQEYSDKAPYLSDSTVPAFSILQTDSTWFSKSNIPENKPFVLIYFNPDCSHCEHTAKVLSNQMADFKDVTFLWVTYLSPLDTIAKFKDEYKFGQYSNVHFGKDLKYAIPSFYRIEYTPFMAAYDEKGKLVQAWTMGTDPYTLKKTLHL